MKFITKSLIMMLGIIGLSSALHAQSVSASATVSATIVTPISITKTTDMNFGNVSVAGSAGTVILSTAGARTTTGGCSLSTANPGTVTAAAFTVNGTGTYTYAITLPSTATTIVNGGNNMTVDTYVSNPSGTGALTAGTQTLLVGGTLHVSATQATGLYTLASGLSVTVSYN
jgi:hypothetical protein